MIPQEIGQAEDTPDDCPTIARSSRLKAVDIRLTAYPSRYAPAAGVRDGSAAGKVDYDQLAERFHGAADYARGCALL